MAMQDCKVRIEASRCSVTERTSADGSETGCLGYAAPGFPAKHDLLDPTSYHTSQTLIGTATVHSECTSRSPFIGFRANGKRLFAFLGRLGE
jgi:hypothetical protein